MKRLTATEMFCKQIIKRGSYPILFHIPFHLLKGCCRPFCFLFGFLISSVRLRARFPDCVIPKTIKISAHLRLRCLAFYADRHHCCSLLPDGGQILLNSQRSFRFNFKFRLSSCGESLLDSEVRIHGQLRESDRKT